MRVTAFILITLIAVFSASLPSGGSHADELTAALTSQQAAEIANSFARKNVEDLNRYTADDPKLDPASRIWSIYFRQTKVPFLPDHDFWVRIDDASGKPCLEYGLVPSCA